MSAVVIDGGLVHYEAFGRGRPILFLHGWLGSWRYWMRTMEAVSDKNRTYALDLWGFGDSDKSRSRYTVSDYVSLVDSFVTDMGIGQVPIVGHALGGMVALEYAVRYPDRTNKIMTVSMPFGVNSIVSNLGDFLGGTSMMSRLIGRGGNQIGHDEVDRELEKTAREAITLSVDSVHKLNISNRLQSIGDLPDAMLLAVYGDKDDIINPLVIQQFQNHTPQNGTRIRAISLPDAKHFPMLDQATKFNRLLKDFLDARDDLSAIELKDEWRRRHR